MTTNIEEEAFFGGVGAGEAAGCRKGVYNSVGSVFLCMGTTVISSEHTFKECLGFFYREQETNELMETLSSAETGRTYHTSGTQ